MPINYKHYHPKWKLISRLIRFKRANNKCEKCFVPNHSIIKRYADGCYRTPSAQEWDMIKSRIRYKQTSLQESLKFHGFTKVVLTVAHLDRDKTNNRFHNLAALCQRCHLKHDLNQHIDNRKYGRHHKETHQLKLL